jgi:hypothetical protein
MSNIARRPYLLFVERRMVYSGKNELLEKSLRKQTVVVKKINGEKTLLRDQLQPGLRVN